MKRKIICVLVLGLLSLAPMTVGKLGNSRTLSYSAWDALITATFENGIDDAIFGVRPDATAGFDSAYDLPEPPPPVEPPYVQAYFRYPGNAPLPTSLYRSCIPPENIMEWPLRVSYHNGADNITLSWNLKNVPANYAVLLYRGEDLVADMRAVNNYTFEATSGNHDFAITTRLERDEIPPPAPSPISPPNGTNITDNTPLLDWSDISDPSGVTYNLSIARDAGFGLIALQKADLTASTYELTPAEALAIGTYYWRAHAMDGVGNVGAWSEIWSFTISIPPPTPPPSSVKIPPITPDAPARIEVENTAITVLEIKVLHTVENAKITIQELFDRPAEIAVAAPGTIYRYLEIIEENITDNDISAATITFKVEKTWIEGENIIENTITLKRYNAENGGWVPLLTTEVDRDATYVYFSVTSTRLSYFAISGTAISPAPAAFTVSTLSINPLEVSVGEDVSISVMVKNTGDLEGTHTVALEINGAVEALENVAVAGRSDKPVTFVVTKDVEGTYDVEADGLTGTFTVTKPPPASKKWPLIASIVGVLAIIGVAIVFYMKRRFKKQFNFQRGVVGAIRSGARAP